MFTIWEILIIIAIHTIADFPLQTEEMAKKKNHSFTMLFLHASTYTLTWVGASTIYCLALGFPVTNTETINPFIYFCIITFLCHITTDAITSKIVTRRFKLGLFNGPDGGMTWIGYDQIAHYIQLFITYKLIFL